MSSQERQPDVGERETPIRELTPERVLDLLAGGEIEVEGLIPWSSNATLLATVRDGDLESLAIYKPHRGERPLWDFEHGTLGNREVAAYLVSDALGWGLVPPTVLRDGPYGPGSLQFFVHAREEDHFFTIQDDERFAQDLKHLAAFDVIANNADRKSGHCLIDFQGRLWAIDNALCFHTEPKLRTVIWDYATLPVPKGIQDDLRGLVGELAGDASLSRALEALLDRTEVEALAERVRELLEAGRYPEPGPGRPVPWPLV